MSKADVALRQAIRSLEYQERTLESIRTRAAITLTVGYLATGFLLDLSAKHGPWFEVGIISVLALTAAVIGIHWPAPLWVTFDAHELVHEYVDDEQVDVDTMSRDRFQRAGLAQPHTDAHCEHARVGFGHWFLPCECGPTMRAMVRRKNSEPEREPLETLKPNPGRPSERGHGTFGHPGRRSKRPKTLLPNPGRLTKR